MTNRLGNYFHHRHNGDGTLDSICCGCYVTVASVREEPELAQFEDGHVCQPVRLHQVAKYAHCAISALARGFGAPQLSDGSN
jgi:hypothetical protein